MSIATTMQAAAICAVLAIGGPIATVMPAQASEAGSYGPSTNLNIPEVRRKTASKASRQAVKAAQEAYQAGDLPGTLAALQPALDKGDSPDAYELAARVHLDQLNGTALQDAVSKGLSLDGRHAGLREVIGRAFVLAGEVPLAEQQLDILRKVCRGKCPERERLADAIAGAKAPASVAANP